MSDDFRIMPMMQTGGNTFTTEVRGTQHTYYLTGQIEAPENYVDLCNILRTAGPQDEVIIRINSRGGFVSSERMIVNAIMESQANVKGFIEYDCMSAATGVFLACSEHGWGEHIQFMAHCSWWGSVGKNPDVKSQTEFGIKQMEEEIETTYAGLMTPEEISQCNDGKEFWFGAKELEERMGNFYEYHAERGCDNPDCNECSGEPMPSIDSIITDAVAEGVEQALDKLLKKYTLTEKEKPKKVPAKKPTSKKLPEVFPDNPIVVGYDFSDMKLQGA